MCMNIFFLPCALSGYIIVNPFTSCVTDHYQHKQCIIMETETDTNMKIGHIQSIAILVYLNNFHSVPSWKIVASVALP